MLKRPGGALNSGNAVISTLKGAEERGSRLLTDISSSCSLPEWEHNGLAGD